MSSKNSPTNGELAVMIEGIHSEIRNVQSANTSSHNSMMKELTEVKVQATMTNGRLRKNEKAVFIAYGALIILNVLFVPIILHFLIQKISQ